MHSSRPQDSEPIDPLAEPCGRKWLFIRGPQAPERAVRIGGGLRACNRTVSEVKHKERLMARFLPNQLETIFGGQAVGSLIALRHLAQFVCIKKDRAINVLPPSHATSVLCRCFLDHRERIATPKDDSVQVHLPMPLLYKASKKRQVASLTFPFAAQKNAPALWNTGAPRDHSDRQPICGTAPNMPPRYFR
jgi:hypothetical protein